MIGSSYLRIYVGSFSCTISLGSSVENIYIGSFSMKSYVVVGSTNLKICMGSTNLKIYVGSTDLKIYIGYTNLKICVESINLKICIVSINLKKYIGPTNMKIHQSDSEDQCRIHQLWARLRLCRFSDLGAPKRLTGGAMGTDCSMPDQCSFSAETYCKPKLNHVTEL